MPRAEIDAAVRSWDQLNSPIAKLKTSGDFRNALKTPSKRSDVIRGLAAVIERAKTEKDMASSRKFVLAVAAAPVGSTNLVDILLQAQSSDALTGACASVVLSSGSRQVPIRLFSI